MRALREITDPELLPLTAFHAAPWKKHPDTLEGGGGGKGAPKPPKPEKPPQAPKAPQASVYSSRNQAAGKGGMSAGYQSTLLTGTEGVQADSVYQATQNLGS